MVKNGTPQLQEAQPGSIRVTGSWQDLGRYIQVVEHHNTGKRTINHHYYLSIMFNGPEPKKAQIKVLVGLRHFMIDTWGANCFCV